MQMPLENQREADPPSSCDGGGFGPGRALGPSGSPGRGVNDSLGLESPVRPIKGQTGGGGAQPFLFAPRSLWDRGAATVAATGAKKGQGEEKESPPSAVRRNGPVRMKTTRLTITGAG